MSPRAVVNWWPDDEDDYEVARTELKKRFATWRGTEGDDSDGELPIHHKWTYGSGHLTRWTCRDLDEVYLEIYPAKVIVADDELGEVLDEARQFMTFLAEEDLLDSESDSLDVLVEHVGAIEGQFRINMVDPSLFSFGKRLWSSAGAEGVRMDDRASVEAFIADFNARSPAERDAILGPRLQSRPAGGRITAPGTRPQVPSPKRRKRKR